MGLSKLIKKYFQKEKDPQNKGQNKKDKFSLGIDYVISEDGRAYLLEMNLCPGGRDEIEISSSVKHFFHMGAYKTHQHYIFGDLMPDFTEDKNQFESFIESKKKVVYKKATGSCGREVSVIEKPEWEADLLEEFIYPLKHNAEGKHFPFVIRDLISLTVENGNIEWETEEIFRKQSKVAIEDAKSPNEVYKLNIFNNNAERVEPLPEETKVITEATREAMRRIIKEGTNASWNPTKLFKRALIGYYFGYRIPPFANNPSCSKRINLFLGGKGIESYWYPLVGKLEEAANAARYGSDGVILIPRHSTKWDYYIRTYYRICRNKDDSISERIGHDSLKETSRIKPQSNIFLEEEKPAEEIAKSILSNYLCNRASDSKP